VEDADDILEELGMCRNGAGFPTPFPEDPVLSSLTPGEPADLDAIAERSGIPPARLLPRLFDLEMKGLVGRAGGGRFVRN
jgi:predicted Rossmann fold nucleotide-binding protein DprA/Smf involved in DNA uptake